MVIAVHKGYVKPILPYISDAASVPPVDMISSQIINFISILILAFACVRYRNTREVYKNNATNEGKHINQLNKYSSICALVVGICLVFIGNFQFLEIRSVHSIGFVITIAFIVIDMYFQYNIAFINGNNGIGKKRAFIAVLLIICFVLSFIFANISMRSVGSNLFFDNNFRRYWNWSYNGYVCHVMSALFEWIIIVVLISLYITTFIPEFKTLDLKDLSVYTQNV